MARKPLPNKTPPRTDLVLTWLPDGTLWRFKGSEVPGEQPVPIGQAGKVDADVVAYCAAGPLMYNLLGHIRPVLEHYRDAADMDPEQMKHAAKLDELLAGMDYAQKYCQKKA